MELSTPKKRSSNKLNALMKGLKKWHASFVHLFYPPRCAACEATLQEGEEGLCLKCLLDMPRTGYHLQTDNPAERLFWGKVTVERASSYFFYHKGSQMAHIIHLMKYADRPDLAEYMGRQMAAELSASGFFSTIDCLIPVPLHPRKKRMRGYNQSERIAHGIAALTGLPVETKAVIRQRFTETQTRRSIYQRWQNVEGIFALKAPQCLEGKHVLLVDDVLTTGATLCALAHSLSAIPGLRISILTLSAAGD